MEILEHRIPLDTIPNFQWDRGLWIISGINIITNKRGEIGVEPIYMPILTVERNGSIVSLSIGWTLIYIFTMWPFVRIIGIRGDREGD